MRERDLLEQIIAGCDEALLDAFLRRMDAALSGAGADLTQGLCPQECVFNKEEESLMIAGVTHGLSPELSRKAYVLWKGLTRMSRGRAYRFFVENDKKLSLNHEPDIVDALDEGAVACVGDIADCVASVLGRKVKAADTLAQAVKMVGDKQCAAVATIIAGLYDTEELYELICTNPVYLNALVPTPDGKLVAVMSRKLIATYVDPVVNVAFCTSASEHGSLAQALSILSDYCLNVEFLRLAHMDTGINGEAVMIFVDFSGNLRDTRSEERRVGKECRL